METPRFFGFEYELNGSHFVFDIEAEDSEQAKARAAAIGAAAYVGELRPAKGTA